MSGTHSRANMVGFPAGIERRIPYFGINGEYYFGTDSHGRSSVGVGGLVANQPVEIEGIFLIRD